MKRAQYFRLLAAVMPPLLVFIIAACAAEAYLRWRETPVFLVPKPTDVLRAIESDYRTLLANLWKTATAALLGFGASAIFGVLLATTLSSTKIIRQAFYPYTIFFQTVPIVAIAPLLVLWFEAGLQSVAICAFIVSVFPVITNTLAGLLSTDPALRDLFRLYGAGPFASMWKLRLPSALPGIVTGFRVASGLAVIGAIVGEFVASDLSGDAGLGVMIATSARYGRTDLVFAAVLAASLLGLILLSSINLIGYLLLRRWHASEYENA